MAVDYLSSLNVGSGLNTKEIIDALVEAERAPKASEITTAKEKRTVEISSLGQVKQGFETFDNSLTPVKEITGLSASSSGTSMAVEISDAKVASNFSNSIEITAVASGDLEIWTMNTDGTDKRMLTNELGYDGGPFFSHDGKKIIWRAYYPQTDEEIKDYKSLINQSMIRPMNLQIRTMNSDGTNKKQITFNDGANFAPYFFPGDERIIFCSNMADPKGRDFDLWAVNTDGTNLERITYFKGFDGFPMFSPDGKYFVFASNRNQSKKGDTNIFIAEWIY